MITREQISKAIEAMKVDLAKYEAKYQGKFAETPHVGLGNRKTRCVNEATLPILTCDESCLKKCAGTCYVLSICTIPRPSCRACEARNTVLRRIDPKAYYEHFFKEAERLHLPIRLSDGGDFENEDQVIACIAAEIAPNTALVVVELTTSASTSLVQAAGPSRPKLPLGVLKFLEKWLGLDGQKNEGKSSV